MGRTSSSQISQRAGASASSGPFANAHHFLSARSRETDGTHPSARRSRWVPVPKASSRAPTLFLSRARARPRRLALPPPSPWSWRRGLVPQVQDVCECEPRFQARTFPYDDGGFEEATPALPPMLAAEAPPHDGWDTLPQGSPILPGRDPFSVLIAGGGVAAIEAALALRELSEGEIRVQLLGSSRASGTGPPPSRSRSSGARCCSSTSATSQMPPVQDLRSVR